MENLSLDASRLDGEMVGLGCTECPIRDLCGGWTRVGGGWSCESVCAHCDANTCDKVCLRKASIATDLREVGGLHDRDIGQFNQSGLTAGLPRYIPVIYNGSGRMKKLRVPWAAVPIDSLIRKPCGQPAIGFSDVSSLLRDLKLCEGTKLFLSGIRKDKYIEEYWRWRKVSKMVDALAHLNLHGAVTPNYSLSLLHPRPQHLFNRKRILICGDEWSQAGIPAIPCLQAVTSADYDYWLDFLRRHPEIFIVCQEFQTGGAKRERGTIALQRYASLQSDLNRPLHFVAVAGYKYRHLLRKYFNSWTVVDSAPFIKAQKHQKLQWTGHGIRWIPARAHSVADLLEFNILNRMKVIDYV